MLESGPPLMWTGLDRPSFAGMPYIPITYRPHTAWIVALVAARSLSLGATPALGEHRELR